MFDVQEMELSNFLNPYKRGSGTQMLIFASERCQVLGSNCNLQNFPFSLPPNPFSLVSSKGQGQGVRCVRSGGERHGKQERRKPIVIFSHSVPETTWICTNHTCLK